MKYLSALFMVMGLLLQAQTKIIAHRGFWNTTPPTSENSLEALKNAQKLKVYGSEFDVHLTADKELVVNHDDDFQKMNIATTSLKQLKTKKLSNGEKLPTLKDFLRQARKSHDFKLIVELKPAKTKTLEDETVAETLKLIRRFQVEDQCEYISFSLNMCKEIKRLNPAAKVQYLKGDLSPEQIKTEGLDGLDYHYSVYEKNPAWIGEAKKLGLTTNAWTVNDVEVFKKLQAAGIDFITTNIPDSLLRESASANPTDERTPQPQ